MVLMTLGIIALAIKMNPMTWVETNHVDPKINIHRIGGSARTVNNYSGNPLAYLPLICEKDFIFFCSGTPNNSAEQAEFGYIPWGYHFATYQSPTQHTTGTAASFGGVLEAWKGIYWQWNWLEDSGTQSFVWDNSAPTVSRILFKEHDWWLESFEVDLAPQGGGGGGN